LLCLLFKPPQKQLDNLLLHGCHGLALDGRSEPASAEQDVDGSPAQSLLKQEHHRVHIIFQEHCADNGREKARCNQDPEARSLGQLGVLAVKLEDEIECAARCRGRDNQEAEIRELDEVQNGPERSTEINE
jgi:hypothetical protein